MAVARITKALIEAARVPAGARFIQYRDRDVVGLTWRLYASGRAAWYLTYRVAGKLKWFRIADGWALAPEQARREARRRHGEIAGGGDPQAERIRERAERITFAQFVDDVYAPWAMQNLKSGRDTVRRLRTTWSTLLSKRLQDVDALSIERCRGERLKAGGGRRDAGNRDLAYLKAALSKAVLWGFLETNPASRVKLGRVDTTRRKRVLSVDEVQRLLRALRERDARIRADRREQNQWRRDRGFRPRLDDDDEHFPDHVTPYVILLLNCGLRRSEGLDLKWRHVDLANRQVTLDGATTKSGKTRVVDLNDQAFAALSTWREQHPKAGPDVYVFPGTGGKRMPALRQWKEVVTAAGLEGVGLHSLRHTFASRLGAAGVDARTIMDLCGHSSLAVTMGYLHSDDARRRAAVKALEADMAPDDDDEED